MAHPHDAIDAQWCSPRHLRIFLSSESEIPKASLRPKSLLFVSSFARITFLRLINFNSAPAQEAVKYKHVVFTQGFRNEKSKYQGPPNEAVDQAWEDLYGACHKRLSINHTSY